MSVEIIVLPVAGLEQLLIPCCLAQMVDVYSKEGAFLEQLKMSPLNILTDAAGEIRLTDANMKCAIFN